MPNNRTKLRFIYFVGFLLTVHTALLAYIESSFVADIVGEKYTGIIMAAGSVVTFLGLANISFLLNKIGNLKATIIFLVAEFLSIMGVVFLTNPPLVIFCFLVSYVGISILFFNMDVLLKQFSTREETGSIRGFFLAINNTAWVISPFVAGLITAGSGFRKVFFVAALLLIPVLVVMFAVFEKKKEPRQEHLPFLATLKQIYYDKDLYNIFAVRFFLQFIYRWRIIYIPIFLNRYLEFDWTQIGIILSIMMIPYALFTWPVGILADKRFGEGPFLTWGFILIAIPTGSLAFISSRNIVLWALVLFISEIGASFAEVASESFFFKRIEGPNTNVNSETPVFPPSAIFSTENSLLLVPHRLVQDSERVPKQAFHNSQNTRIIGFFRNTQPMAAIIAPLIATAFLFFFPYKYLFLFFGASTLWGARHAILISSPKNINSAKIPA